MSQQQDGVLMWDWRVLLVLIPILVGPVRVILLVPVPVPVEVWAVREPLLAQPHSGAIETFLSFLYRRGGRREMRKVKKSQIRRGIKIVVVFTPRISHPKRKPEGKGQGQEAQVPAPYFVKDSPNGDTGNTVGVE